MVSFASLPTFVQSFPGPMWLSLALEVLPLREEGRSACSVREVLPGFFVVLFALTVIANPLVTLMLTLFHSS